ncbi:MAG: hypothetical protein HY526_10415 [Betaproteobacteria bacterium]|nr:hypothetical protein [Betaproteobacteria bacterium]
MVPIHEFAHIPFRPFGEFMTLTGRTGETGAHDFIDVLGDPGILDRARAAGYGVHAFGVGMPLRLVRLGRCDELAPVSASPRTPTGNGSAIAVGGAAGIIIGASGRVPSSRPGFKIPQAEA